eukprot:gene14824-20052_t
MLAVVMLIGVILCVQIQVVGRYVFNDTPTWAEGLALQLVLFVTALGVAVGVRDAGHIGLESLVSLLPEAMRLKLEVLIHALVALFGGLMAWNGWIWTRLKWAELDPMLHLPVGIDYLSLVIAGALIVIGAGMELTVLSLSFALLLILGVPVAFSIGLASAATILYA